jgi:hypothetical protein
VDATVAEERLQLLAGDKGAVSAFLDDLDVRSPREREMLSEIAETSPLARPDRFLDDHKRVVNALESLRRHGFHGSRVAASAGTDAATRPDHRHVEGPVGAGSAW